MSKQRKDIVIIDLDLPEVNNLEEEIDRITEKLKKANSLADELASKKSTGITDDALVMADTIIGVLEKTYTPELIARIVNTYFNPRV